MKKLSILLAIAGLALVTGMVGYFGLDTVAASVTSIGWSGFALLVAWQSGLFVVLGSAWDVLVPRRLAERPWWTFYWGRMVRDSAGNCLPFSQVGGYVFGARVLRLHHVGWPLATASTVVDVTAEFLGQIVFAAMGLAILAWKWPGSGLTLPLGIALALALPACAGFVWSQHGAAPIIRRLGERIGGDRFQGTGTRLDAFQVELEQLYKFRGTFALATVLHVVAWIGTGVAGWLAYRLLGADIDLLSVLALEAFLNVALALAFLVPGAAGVQEAAYAGIGTFFGLPPELSFTVSILRRAKDVALGIPILLAYQLVEVRRLGIANHP